MLFPVQALLRGLTKLMKESIAVSVSYSAGSKNYPRSTCSSEFFVCDMSHMLQMPALSEVAASDDNNCIGVI